MMGIGDDIIATSMAKGAAVRGKRVAFGDGSKIIWGPHSKMIFRNNPNVAPPGHERSKDVSWVRYYKGSRIYNAAGLGRWIWNYEFKVTPGEIYFDRDEIYPHDDRLILIEPNVPNKPCGPNKQWPVDRWRELTRILSSKGWRVVQFQYGRPNLVSSHVETFTFRHAAALLKSARLAVLPEGGLHHAAAAVSAPAVVLFGGFVPPSVLGYEGHVNLTGGSDACGSFTRCQHCVEAMNKITVDEVVAAAEKLL